MWQLEMEAMKASSGSTCAGLENGTGTTDGEADAGTMTPPSNVQVCSREYLPVRKSGLVRCHLIVALYSDITVGAGEGNKFKVLHSLAPVWNKWSRQ
jgi:hypothetical protein